MRVLQNGLHLCPRCGEEKAPDQFARLAVYCRVCQRAYESERQRKKRAQHQRYAVPVLTDEALREKAEAFIASGKHTGLKSAFLRPVLLATLSPDDLVQFVHSLASEGT